MKTNEAGIKLIQSFEGCKLDSYQDQRGIWTIGYGSTGHDIVPELTWTQTQADERFVQDLAKFEQQVSEMVKVLLQPNQFSALVSFTYNLGPGALLGSTLLKKINLEELAADEFLKWDKVRINGVLVENKGLLRRRTAERDLFLS